MVNIFTANTERPEKARKGRRTWSHFVRVMAMVVVFCTTYALILPAITIESGTICGIGEHTHTDECYAVGETVACAVPESESHAHTDACYTIEENALTCALEEAAAHTHSEACSGQVNVCGLEEAAAHTHTDACSGRNLVCTEKEAPAHTHSDACSGEFSLLICGEAESENHSHTDSCYKVQTLTCDLTETVGHVHADACYETAIVCGLEETEGHTHTETCCETGNVCGLEETEGHTHTETCYDTVKTQTCGLEETEGHSHENDEQPMELVCQLPEHVHTEECYPVTEETTSEATEETAAPVSDPTADVETAEIWEASMAAVKLTGDWSEDLLAIARSQMGYTESALNFTVSETGEVSGYSRYGAWYGIPYGNWCAMFVSFCLEYAGVEDISRGSSCTRWINDLTNSDQYRTADVYTPVPGDIIFFNTNEDEGAEHVGIVEQIIPATEEEPAKIRVIEGNSSNRVRYVDYAVDDATIMGYGVLPTEPGATYEYADDSVSVTVVLPKDTTVPETAVLTVTPIESDADDYDALVEKANDAVDGTVTKIKLYDISFYTEDGTYIPVDDEAKVSLRFVESPVDVNANVEVLHFAEEDAVPVVLAGVTVAEETPVVEEEPKTLEELTAPITSESETVEPAPETVVEFQTDGFSTFAVVEVETGVYEAVILNPGTDVADVVEGKYDAIDVDGDDEFIIVSADMKFALSSYAYISDSGEDKLKGMAPLKSTDTNVDSNVYFNANKHLLWKFVESDTDGAYYIQSVATGEYLQLVRAGIALTTELTEGDPDNRQAIYAFKDENTHKVGFAVKVGNEFFYLNRDGGGSNYHTYTKAYANSANNQFYLCKYQKTIDNLNVTVEYPSVTIPAPNKVYMLAGVNYNDQYPTINEEGADTTNDTAGRPTILTGENATDQQIQTGANNTMSTLRHLTGEFATEATYKDNSVYFMSHKSNNHYLWLFEQTGTENVYNINRMGTDEYLHIDQDGMYVAAGKQNITVEKVDTTTFTPVVQNGVIRLKATVTEDGEATTYYAFLNGNAYDANDAKDFTAISSYKGRDEATTAAEHSAHFVMFEYGTLVDGLEGKSYIISGVNNKEDTDDKITGALLTPESDEAKTGLPKDGWFGLKSSTNAAIQVTGGTVTNLKVDEGEPSDYAWEFQDDGYGRYKIRSVKTGQYLKIEHKGLSLEDVTMENAQTIEVIAASASKQTMRVKNDIICLRNLDNDYVLLYNNNCAHAFTGQKSSPEDKLEENRGTELIISEYKATSDTSVLATDLGGKVYFAVAVNNANSGQDNPPLLASTGDPGLLTGENRAVTVAPEEGKPSFEGDTLDGNENLAWYFEQTAIPGAYHLIAVNGGKDRANKGKYLKVSADDNGGNKGALSMVDSENEASLIEVVQADTSAIAADAKNRATENVICLRVSINGDYYYVNLNANSNNENFQSYKNEDVAVKDGGNHFILIEIEDVNTIVSKINTLLDNLVLEDDGDWVFSDAAYYGSALPGNDNANGNHGQQGDYGESHSADFIDDYEQAKAYRREMQLLAREIRKLYAELPDEEKKFVWRYEIVDSEKEESTNGTDINRVKDLKWLWDVVVPVPSDDPIGVKVNLFNYDSTINDTGLADVNGENNGFTFYHKVMYDEYTQIDTGRDNNRKANGVGTLGSDDSRLDMYDYLVGGYPSIRGGDNSPVNEFSPEGGSLAYLFTPNNQYWKASMTDGGGLFQRDADGYYYYYANKNAAWYNPATNRFVLYDTVIRPMYNHGVQPHQVNDVYNFLPFNNPYDDLIFDEYNTIMDNHVDTDYSNYAYQVNEDNDPYKGVANSHAETEKSGYLNERSDMWFGMTIEFDFLMPEDGMIGQYDEEGNLIGELKPMVFDFYGDDDVWVYIDDKLVLDIGGVHEAQSGSIDFSTGAVKYQTSANTTVETTLGKIFGTSAASARAVSGNTFEDYSVHSLKFFYMERGGNVSYAGIKFNMPPMPANYLMVSKDVEASGTDTVIDQNQYYTFRVVQANSEGVPLGADGNPLTPVKNADDQTIDSAGNVTNDSAKFVYNPNDMVSFFTEYTTYDEYKGGSPTGGMGIVDADGYFSVRDGYQAMFPEILKHRANDDCNNFIVQEIIFDSATQQYVSVTYDVEHVDKEDTSPKTTNESTSAFTKDAIQSQLDNRGSGMGFQTTHISANNSHVVTMRNTPDEPFGELSVEKTLAETSINDANKAKEFTIMIELGSWKINNVVGSPNEVRYEIVYSPIPTGSAYTVYDSLDNNNLVRVDTVTSADGTITLKHGQYAVFTGLLADTYYRVSEMIGANEKWTPTYTGTVTDSEGASSTPNYNGNGENNATGSIGYGDKVEVTVTNTDYDVPVKIPIKKTVMNGSVKDKFTFIAEWVNDAFDLDAVKNALSNPEAQFTSVPGTSITVDPGTSPDATGEVVLGFSNEAINGMEKDIGHAFYRFREQKGNGSYVYDNTFYIVEVELNKKGATDEGKVRVINVWKGTEGSSDLTECQTNLKPGDTVLELEFVNERTTSIKIKKDIVNGVDDGHEFKFTVRYPENGSTTTRTVYVAAGSEEEISGIPVGAVVEVTEVESENEYRTTYQVYTRYEAEYGILEHGAIGANNANASGGRYVGGVGLEYGGVRGAGSVTIPVYMVSQYNESMSIRYSQDDSRLFGVSVNGAEKFGVQGEDLGDWGVTWGTVNTKVQLNPGANTIVISGMDSDAPNLDYIEFMLASGSGKTVSQAVGDMTIFHFSNEPLLKVRITKHVEGSEETDKNYEYGFTVKIVEPDGKVLCYEEFTLKDSASKDYSGIPFGSLITVEETEDGDANETRMQVSTRLEAENAVTTGAVDIRPSEDASGGRWAGNIHTSSTLTFNDIKVYGDANPTLNLFYMQDDTRHFNVSVNGNVFEVPGDDCDTWSDWTKGKTAAVEKVDMLTYTEDSPQTNTIVVSGVPGKNADNAPNLDYIDIVWDEVSNTKTVTQYVNGDTTIEVVNETGYELPESGGEGTSMYIFGGLLLMLLPVVYYGISKRSRRERRAGA